MISGVLIFSLLMPIQVNGGSFGNAKIFKPLILGAVIDSARILGLPNLRLRNSNGSLYLPDKAIYQEALAVVQKEAGITSYDIGVVNRRLFLLSYIKR